MMFLRGVLGIQGLRNGGRRLYHSIDHSMSNLIVNGDKIESKILTKALDYIPQYGVHKQCITQAIRDLGFPDSINALLAAGNGSVEYQLCQFWLKFQRQKLNDYIVQPDSQFHKLSDEYERVEHLINKRLEYNQPIKPQLSQILSQLVIPYNIPSSLEELHNLSDDISFFAGDSSIDFAWYSKRFTVSTIYVSSELFQLQDSSKDFISTKQFVNDKVREMKKLGNAYNDVEQWGVFNAISLVNLIKSQLIRG